MNDVEIPSEKLDCADMLKNILISCATGGIRDNETYQKLRNLFISNTITDNLLPRFIKTCRDLDSFWAYIQPEDEKYAGRRKIIRDSLQPLFEYLEQNNVSPSDNINSDILQKFDADGVKIIWDRAISRINNEPEGAITLARTLLESVCKHILDNKSITYNNKDDLPKLYQAAAKELNISPSSHTEEAFKSILGGGVTIVNGIGTLRNRLSDAHGRGKILPVKPSPRHAKLAVNCAGAIASFLIETYNEKVSS